MATFTELAPHLADGPPVTMVYVAQLSASGAAINVFGPFNEAERQFLEAKLGPKLASMYQDPEHIDAGFIAGAPVVIPAEGR